MDLYGTDLRSGLIRIDHLYTRVNALPTSVGINQAFFFVEQEEDAFYLRSTLKIPALFPTHWTAKRARPRELCGRPGAPFGRRAVPERHSRARFPALRRTHPLQFTRPRLLPVNQPVREWLRLHHRNEIEKLLPPPLRLGELHSASNREQREAKLGGSAGGKASAAKLTKKERVARARKASIAAIAARKTKARKNVAVQEIV